MITAFGILAMIPLVILLLLILFEIWVDVLFFFGIVGIFALMIGGFAWGLKVVFGVY